MVMWFLTDITIFTFSTLFDTAIVVCALNAVQWTASQMLTDVKKMSLEDPWVNLQLNGYSKSHRIFFMLLHINVSKTCH